MRHILTYQIAGIEHDTGRQYQTITTVGIQNPSEADTLIDRWNTLSRSKTVNYTLLNVKPANDEQQKQIDNTTQFTDGTVRRSFTLSEIVKTEGAIKVLQLLDSEEDAPEQYEQIMQLVAKEMSITTKQLEHEVNPFI